MSNVFLFLVLVFCSCAPALAVRKTMSRRIQSLEQDLQHICNTVVRMAEKDVKSHSKISASIDGLEERIMELSVPSHNTGLPLERRHQVWTLARRGMSIEDISKRLKAPVGETELILNLGKYSGAERFQAGGNNQQVGQHV